LVVERPKRRFEIFKAKKMPKRGWEAKMPIRNILRPRKSYEKGKDSVDERPK
jgi:hypothetical protein